MISLALIMLVASSPNGTSINDDLACKMIPQADESDSVELCANDQQWESIISKVGGDIDNLHCIYLDNPMSEEPVRACGTKNQLMKKTGTSRVQDISDVECKQIIEVGSRIPRKICQTKKQWEAASRESAGQVSSDLRNRTGN